MKLIELIQKLQEYSDHGISDIEFVSAHYQTLQFPYFYTEGSENLRVEV